MLLLAHQNPAEVHNGHFRVDRKFDTGMRYYCSRIPDEIVCLHPRPRLDYQFMDPIEVQRTDAMYRMVALDVDQNGRPTEAANTQLKDLIRSSRLVYGQSLGAAKMAAALGVPYISIVEYTVGTQVTVSTCDDAVLLRKLVRGARTAADYYFRQLPELSGAASIHCNGYPIYDALQKRHLPCLLYLDSRVTSDMVIDAAALENRLAERPLRNLRLLYSGRFVKMKGACDVVATGLALKRLNVDFELNLYGQGPERSRMEAMIKEHNAGAFIHIHDSVSFEDLFEISKSSDLFVCCHIQSDPSCSYLEAHGAGLPIAGYGNQMWRRLQGEAQSGVVSSVGDAAALARKIVEFVKSTDFDAAAVRARSFALAHSFESEFERRVEDIRSHLRLSKRAA